VFASAHRACSPSTLLFYGCQLKVKPEILRVSRRITNRYKSVDSVVTALLLSHGRHMKHAPPVTQKILLVDDSRDGLLIRRLVLEEAGFEVQVATCGEEALDLFRSTRFAVVVTDYRMPTMNGGELISRLRSLEANARIILLSGFVDQFDLTEANTRADAVILKSSNEAAHLTRWVRRLASMPLRKPPVTQYTSGQTPPKNLAHYKA
jgi:CheY-like chemotaxis protein